MVAWGRADGALTPDRPIDDDDGAKAAVCTTAVPRALPLAGPVSPVRSTFLRHTKSLATTDIVPMGQTIREQRGRRWWRLQTVNGNFKKYSNPSY